MYVFDTLFMAVDLPVMYVTHPPANGPWVLYAPPETRMSGRDRCIWVAHCEKAWDVFKSTPSLIAKTVGGLACPVPDSAVASDALDVGFDLVVNALYFLACWGERATSNGSRTLFRDSLFARTEVPQDIVDTYLERLLVLVKERCQELGWRPWAPNSWPQGSDYSIVLSHDIDYIPANKRAIVWQGVKSVSRHLVRQRDLVDAARALGGLVKAIAQGRDPYGCIPEIIAREKALGVRASFQVAVGRRHPADVTYRIEDDATRDYVALIPQAGFDLCLHGSYRSTERLEWYVEEARLLSQRLCRPIGSRQHFLSFNYDNLFSAQERAGVQYDMSVGYPDHVGPRAGFSYPYFPYSLAEDRPYDVVEISLFLMDVTLRSYMGLRGEAAWRRIAAEVSSLHRKRGCVSIVWHPIVFGGARDPGDAELFWRIVSHVAETGGYATDGRSINSLWRDRAQQYPSFANVSSPVR